MHTNGTKYITYLGEIQEIQLLLTNRATHLEVSQLSQFHQT